MNLLVVALLIWAGASLCSLLAWRSKAVCSGIGVAGALAAAAVGLIPTIQTLRTGAVQTLHLPWSMPLGNFVIAIDPLSAWFLLPVLIVPALAAVYGASYLRSYKRDSLALPWFFYNLLTASMALVCLARNGVLFLLAWELMSLASYFLVTFESEKESVRHAGWVYLVATHLGTALILVLFVMMSHGGSMDFDQFSPGSAAGIAFVLAVIGFGTKAGFMPFHVWLPEAHPAAPSHVSAVMSGVMIKMGIYGLVRTLSLLGPVELWWAFVLLGVGLVSGVLGALFALSQHELKRLLAYSSVENIGIITLGLGVGVLGMAFDQPVLAGIGFAGALLHVLNHSLFKGLLFLGAGGVLHATHSGQIDGQGGLLKRMPLTGASFLVASVAICGLPPLNGFVSEILVYLSAYGSVATLPVVGASAACATLAGLALIGGLAVAAFAKAFGIVFLGVPRTPAAQHAHESSPAMVAPMVLLALACVGASAFAPFLLKGLAGPVGALTGQGSMQAKTTIDSGVSILWSIQIAATVLVMGILVLAALRAGLLSRGKVEQAGTWDCGYAQPTPRIQYTGSSFVQPMRVMFRFFLPGKTQFIKPSGLLPNRASFTSQVSDLFMAYMHRPVFLGTQWFLGRFRWMQHGRVQLYVMYIALALLGLLAWKLR